jgi:hypothetical protein
MKHSQNLSILFAFICLAIAPAAFADRLLLLGDRTVEGTVLQTNGDNIVLLTDYGTLTYSRGLVKEIIVEQTKKAKQSASGRFPDSRNIILLLNRQPWASNLKQIPATVIDKGILKNVPYISFRCGSNYEVNIYGDLDHPAGIEAGVYHDLVNDPSAKANCITLIQDLLTHIDDRAVVGSLNTDKDLKTQDSLTFEITPPEGEDAYGGWWISVYSEPSLNFARASDQEMNQISTPKSQPITATNITGWTVEDLKLARPSSRYPTTITFTDTSGQIVTNAQVVRVNDGVSLIWRDGVSGGLLKLADLSEALRKQFGYDPAKAAAADEADRQKKEESAQAYVAAQQAAIANAQEQSVSDSYGGGSAYGGYSGGGRVYVSGYTRSNGTYVAPYTRSYPRR